jgi:dCTP diphosphatase
MNDTQKINDITITIQTLKEHMAQFVAERDWQQFHTPKNLSMSIAIEAAELMEKFQFVDTQESVAIAQKYKEEVAHELVDVLCYVLSFANACAIDLSSTCIQKIALNAQKYPADRARGDYAKYIKLKKNS